MLKNLMLGTDSLMSLDEDG